MFPSIKGHGQNIKGSNARDAQTIDLLKAGDAHRKMAHTETDPQKKQEMLDEALQSYQMALASNPDCWEAHYGCGIVFRRCGELEEAVECFEAALDIEPSGRNGIVWNICGSTLGSLSDFARAKERIERAIEIDPKSKKFRRELKRLEARRTGNSFLADESDIGDERNNNENNSPTEGQEPQNDEDETSKVKHPEDAPKKKTHLDKMREELANMDEEIKDSFKSINAVRNGKRRRATAKKSNYFEPDYDVDYKHGQQTVQFSKPWVEKFASKNSDGGNAEPSGLGSLAANSLKKMTEITVAKEKGSDDTVDNLGCILPALTDLSSVFRALEVLDLSGNRMNSSGTNSLADFLEHRACHVVTLKCERANLSDGLGARLLRVIKENNSLRAIYLRHNCMKHKSFTALGVGLSQNGGLREVIIGSNNLYGVGLEALSQGLAANKGLRRLDVSWNLLGRHEDDAGSDLDAPRRALKSLGMALAVNKSLLYLSMNNCSLAAGLCTVFGEGIAFNQTIYGLGFQGNKGTTDSKGNIRMDLVPEKVLGLEPEPERGSAVAHAGESWDTHRWSQHEFVFTSGVSGEVDPENGKLYLHVMFDDWKPDEMQISYGDGSVESQLPHRGVSELAADFRLDRMVPPGRIWYFYSQGWRVLCARDQPIAEHPRLHVSRNFVDIAPRLGRLDPSILRVIPRTEPWDEMEEDDLKILVTSKPDWDLRSSLFTARERVGGAYFDEEMITEALTNDLNLTKILPMKVVANEEELSELQEALEKVYGDLVALFRWYAARDDLSDPFTISWEECRDFARDAGMIDRYLTEGSMKNEFILTNVELDEAADNDDDSLVRFEFVELVTRLAQRKFVATKHCETLSEAVLMMHEEIIEPYMEDMQVYSADEFRKTCLYTEQMCLVFDKHKAKLERMFQDHTSAESNGSPVMLLDDLMEMMKDGGLVSLEANNEKLLKPNRVRKIFLTSILIVSNEQTTEKFKQLGFVDFLEALARIAQQQYLVEVMETMDQRKGKKLNHRDTHHNHRDRMPTIEGALGRLIGMLIHELYAEQGHGYMILKRQKKKERREKMKAKAATAAMMAAGPKYHVPEIPGLPRTELGYATEVKVPRMLGGRGGRLSAEEGE